MGNKSSKQNPTSQAMRLDKWLWAARFFKTRSLARSMIENGKIKYNGQRCKASRTVEVGALLTIQQGFDEKQISVLGLSDNRLSAPLAQELYQESAESIKKRSEQAELRKLQHSVNPRPDSKPDKKQRRQLIEAKQHKLGQ
ncbi:heat shock protein 15 [Catenovulum agarivorans DS-2]|uniref:Heat shock protein 15 n=1 Tax=Catenovulum agarivorans DS-2 TaxID=1328313 RepID=W7QTQ3_9ALTE|nr:ribosome-associated heat shock protein Hsp15 [Catenovulum agarivorans]EWH11228.1 heat shock protein 15 [Catenovulum agarivorans DS-2]